MVALSGSFSGPPSLSRKIHAELPTVTKKIVFVTKFGREYENTKVHPKSTILASYGIECYRHSFPTIKANTRHLF